MKVNLEWFEVSRAALVGVSRNVEALRKNCSATLQKPTDEWSAHILGALGECAFAKCTNRYWNGSVNTFKAGGDLGDNIQIRTRSKHSYDLIVRDADRDSDVFVLVTGGPHEFRIHGWMPASEAKQARFKANYGGYGDAYFVPASALRPIDPLICKEC
jgi:hypothetical protein